LINSEPNDIFCQYNAQRVRGDTVEDRKREREREKNLKTGQVKKLTRN
jgi:hypothetical protein